MIKVESQYSTLSNSLLRILDSKSCGLLEVSTLEFCTPLIVMITQDLTDRDILVAFCVDQPNNSDVKDSIYTKFREMFSACVLFTFFKIELEERILIRLKYIAKLRKMFGW